MVQVMEDGFVQKVVLRPVDTPKFIQQSFLHGQFGLFGDHPAYFHIFYSVLFLGWPAGFFAFPAFLYDRFVVDRAVGRFDFVQVLYGCQQLVFIAHGAVRLNG